MITVNKNLITIKSPCVKCPHRSAECHGVCDQYKTYKQKIRSLRIKGKNYENNLRNNRSGEGIL